MVFGLRLGIILTTVSCWTFLCFSGNLYQRAFAEGRFAMNNYPEWVEKRFGDNIPDWAEERWGDGSDEIEEDEEDD